MSWVSTIGKNLRELRLIMCQTSARSQGMRDFVFKNYNQVKDANPRFPFIVRECEEVDPLIIARYQFGIEKKVYTSNLSSAEIERIIEDFVQQADNVNKQI